VAILGEKFGYTTNAKGYKVLNNVRLIQGDGVNEHTIRMILGGFQAYGWSADNIAFGMGGALLQQVDRDTQKFAMKCSSAKINGEWVDVQKDPITDSGKKSKAGRVNLWTSGGEFESAVKAPKRWTDKGISMIPDWMDAMQEVYRDGKLVKEITFEQVRANAKA
jgi:nicotinamide phosphoribosyltransferase